MVVNRRTVAGSPELRELAAEEEQYCPEGDFNEVSSERDSHGERDDGHVFSEDRPGAAQSSFAAKEIHAGAQSHAVDNDGTYDGGGADQEWNKNRSLVGLRHPLAAHGFQKIGSTCLKS